jgi:hypothetical protein
MHSAGWFDYFGAATGVLGMLFGVAGACLGYLGYRRSTDMKTIDLRLELRRTVVAARATLEEIPVTVDRAMASRSSRQAAAGAFRSDAHQAWIKMANADRARLFALREGLPADHEAFDAQPPTTLESKIIEIEMIVREAKFIREKYSAEPAESASTPERV